MCRLLLLLTFLLRVNSAWAGVEVYVEEGDGKAWVKYECTGGEVVRAFALDVTVDKGRILGISDFFAGESTLQAQGYGIFPASFRDHITIGSGTNIDWEVSGYSPLAAVADNPGDTRPGLGSAGVTLEFGGLWDRSASAAVPGPAGVLCALQISEGATVSVTANASRGGVLAANPDRVLDPVFSGAFVQPPQITGVSMGNGVLSILFAGGELESADVLEGPWTGTGDTDGQYTESVGLGTNRFYRVRAP